MMPADFLAVLTHPTLPMSKVWQRDGTIKAYGEGKRFRYAELPLDSFDDLSRALTELETARRSFAIRGRYLGDDTARRLDNEFEPGTVRRLKDLHADVPHHWVLVEVDNYVPMAADPVLEPVDAIEEYIACCLPEPFRDASYHWQMSNSAGHVDKRHKLKAHVWFWLEEPETSGRLRTWAKNEGLEVDTAVFNPVQVHYTAAPIFDEGVADPVPQRSGRVDKASSSVPLTIPSDIQPLERKGRLEVLEQAYRSDPVAVLLHEKGMVKGTGNAGQLFVECPCSEDHTSESGPSSTAYYAAHTGGYTKGTFVCLHEHCSDRAQTEFLEALGISAADDFDDLCEEAAATSPEAPHSEADDFEDVSDAPAEPEKPKLKYVAQSLAEFTTTKPIDWLIKGVIPRADLVVLYGPPGSGKSFMAIDMAMAVAQGVEWRGHRCKRARVVYLAAEGAGGIRRRFAAYLMEYGGHDGQIKVIDACPNLRNRSDALELTKAIIAGGGCDLLIIDTKAQVMAGGDENSSEDAGALLENIKLMQRPLKCTTLLIDHTGKDEGRGARGWSGLNGAADASLAVVRDADDRVMAVTKMKDGDDAGEYGFKLRVVEIGVDEDLDPITSCVIDHCNTSAAEVTSRKKARAKIGPVQKAVLQWIDDNSIEVGAFFPVETVATGAAEALPVPENGRDRRREVCRRAVGELIKAGFIEEVEGKIRRNDDAL